MVVDAHGVLIPDAAVPLSFTLAKGAAGEISAVGNGDPQDTSSCQADTRTTWRGKALVILRPLSTGSAGEIRLTASAKGIAAATVTVQTSATPSTK
jgi:beta-galactosidase